MGKQRPSTTTNIYDYPADKTGHFNTKITENQLAEATELYLAQCKNENRTPLVPEFVFNLGISRQTHWRYKKKPAYKKYFDLIEEAEHTGLLREVSGGSKPIGSMFLLKSRHNYVESSKLDLTTNGHDLGVVLLPSLKQGK